MSRVRVPSATPQAGRHFRLPAFYASFAVRKQLSEDLLDLARCHRGGSPAVGALVGRQMLALPAFHCSHGMFQSPSPSVPGSVEPTVFTISTMSPRFVLS